MDKVTRCSLDRGVRAGVRAGVRVCVVFPTALLLNVVVAKFRENGGGGAVTVSTFPVFIQRGGGALQQHSSSSRDAYRSSSSPRAIVRCLRVSDFPHSLAPNAQAQAARCDCSGCFQNTAPLPDISAYCQAVLLLWCQAPANDEHTGMVGLDASETGAFWARLRCKAGGNPLENRNMPPSPGRSGGT